MKTSAKELQQKTRIIFWRTVSTVTSYALRHRRGLYQALTVAPVAIVALAAFIVGRGVGVLISSGMF